MLLIDKYAYTNRLKDFNPMAKFIFVIGILLFVITVDNSYINLMIFLSIVFLTIFAAKIPGNRYFKILIIPAVFLFISVITILLSISKDNDYIYSIEIFDRYVGFNYESLETSVKLGIRALASLSATLFLALTTPLNHMVLVFKRLRLPNIFIELFVLIYRSIFIFLDEAKNIVMAQQLKFGYDNIKNTYRSIALLMERLIVGLLIRFKQGEISLETKLYDGEFKVGE